MALHPREHNILKGLKAEKILDIGSGLGYTAEELERLFPKCYGVEPQLNSLLTDQAKTSYQIAKNFFVVAGRGDGLPFLNNTFSGAFSHWSIHHYTYPTTVLTEVYRVVEPGGWLYIADGIDVTESEITPQQANHLLFHRIAVSAELELRKNHFPLCSPSQMEHIVKTAGFVIEGTTIISEENPVDAEYEQEYRNGYIDRISNLAMAMKNMGNSKLLDKLNRLKKSIEQYGIRMAPFVIIVARKK